MILFILLAMVSTCHGQGQGQKKSGLYNITIINMGPCPDGGTNEVVFKTRISKINRTALCYSGWVSLPFGMTDDMQERWEISSLGSTGGWKANFLTFRNKRACSDTKRLFPQWFKVLEYANLNDTSCPIPKGNYSFGCLDLSNLQFERSSVMVYGTYRVTVNYYNKRVKVGCTMYQGVVYPRVNSTETRRRRSTRLRRLESIQDVATWHTIHNNKMEFEKIFSISNTLRLGVRRTRAETYVLVESSGKVVMLSGEDWIKT